MIALDIIKALQKKLRALALVPCEALFSKNKQALSINTLIKISSLTGANMQQRIRSIGVSMPMNNDCYFTKQSLVFT